MTTPLRVLLVEDVEDDALRVLRELQNGGYEVVWERVDTSEAMADALDRETWNIVLCDYVLPRFSGLAALQLLQDKRPGDQ
jgi:CheY-like chemotaxis protein